MADESTSFFVVVNSFDRNTFRRKTESSAATQRSRPLKHS